MLKCKRLSKSSLSNNVVTIIVGASLEQHALPIGRLHGGVAPAELDHIRRATALAERRAYALAAHALVSHALLEVRVTVRVDALVRGDRASHLY